LIAELPGDIKDRLELLELDARAPDRSVKAAADKIVNRNSTESTMRGVSEHDLNEAIRRESDTFLTRLYISIACAWVMGRGGTMTMEEVVNLQLFWTASCQRLLWLGESRVVALLTLLASASGPQLCVQACQMEIR
jgi:hypothetical protein